jgi:hypothetical protein
MKTKIKDYLQLIITFSVAIAVFLFLRPFIHLLLNKFITSMTSSQIGRFFIIIIGVGTIELSCILLYAILAFMVKGVKEGL